MLTRSKKNPKKTNKQKKPHQTLFVSSLFGNGLLSKDVWGNKKVKCSFEWQVSGVFTLFIKH